MGLIDNLLMGFSISLSWDNLMYCFIGCFLGTLVGVLPGLGPGGTMALLLPLTFKMDLTSAIIMLCGIYYGTNYGGTLTSVLMKIPGEASTVVTCLDGYEMARQGRAGPALGIAAFGSFIASTTGIFGIAVLAPPMARLALAFGPPEYSLLMIAAITMVIYLSGKSIVKSLAMAVLGFLLGCVGLDPISGAERFTFGTTLFMEGVKLIPLGMGLFGISEVFLMAEKVTQGGGAIIPVGGIKKLLPTVRDWKDSARPIARGTFLGFFLGIIPGGGAVTSSFISYAIERKFSKHPDKFGHGAIEGVAGPESANNSAVAGALIPLLTLGIPFNIVTALLLAAFLIHGVAPGPMILEKKPEIFWGIVTSMYIGNIMLLLLNLPMIGLFVNILRIPFTLLGSLIGLICFVGAFSVSGDPFDILIMVFFGIVGYLMNKFEYPPAPLLLAFIVGPMLESSMRRSLILSDGSLEIFVSRPISIILICITLICVIDPILRKGVIPLFRRYRKPI